MKKNVIGSIVCAALLSITCAAPALAETASYANVLAVRDANMEFLAEDSDESFGTVVDVVETMDAGFAAGWRFDVQAADSGECGVALMNGTKAVAVVIPLDENGMSIEYDDRDKVEVGTVMVAVQYDGSNVDDIIDTAVGVVNSFSGGDEIANSAILYQLVMSWYLTEDAGNSDDGRYYVGHGMNAYGTGMLAMSGVSQSDFMYFLVCR